MSEQDGFLLPGVFDPLPDGNPAAFHEAGFGYEHLSVMFDPVDVFPNDTDLYQEGVEESLGIAQREQLTQWGPNFVAAIHEHLSEIDRKLDEDRKRHLERWSFEPVTLVITSAMQTTATGGVDQTTVGSAEIFSPPPGFTFALHRMTISNGGNNFGTPFNSAGAYYEIRVNNEMVDGDSLVAAAGQYSKGLPVARTWGTRDAPRIRDGQVLSLFVNAGPTSQKIVINTQGTYDRSAEG